MFKAESGSSRSSSATATSAPSGRRGHQIARRGPTAGEIGFVGLGRMGTAMAKNLPAARHRVIACVRRPQQMGTLAALRLKPTTDLGHRLPAAALELVGESAALLRNPGLHTGRFVQPTTSTLFGGRVHRLYGIRIAAQDYAAGFALPCALKDVRLALAEAESAAVPMP